MAGLKELRGRINSVKSTQKITSAMKMVAAARLRKAQALIGKSSFYNHNILYSANRVLFELKEYEKASGQVVEYPKLVAGTGKDDTYLLIVFSSDRGLCGGFNSSIAKTAVAEVENLHAQGKNVKIICIGKKARDVLKRKYADLILDTYEGIAKKGAKYYEATDIAIKILDMYEKKEFDVCKLLFTFFRSAMNREIINERVLPLQIEMYPYNRLHEPTNVVEGAFYDYEPGDKLKMLEGLAPLIFRLSIFQAIVHSQASEHGARMTSMDSATRNAKDIMSKLTLKYNGIRQTAITTELIEIISGAEAL